MMIRQTPPTKLPCPSKDEVMTALRDTEKTRGNDAAILYHWGDEHSEFVAQCLAEYRAKSSLPNGWADWAARERQFGTRFVEWAEPAPASLSDDRYAIAFCLFSHLRWVRCSPSPDVPIEYSSGAFYSHMHPEGAVTAARTAAMKHKTKVAALVAGDKT